MKNNEKLKKEISSLIKNKIYKNYSWQNGFSIQDLKVVAQELFNCRFKIIKIKVKDNNGKAMIISGRITKNNIPMTGLRKLQRIY